MFDDAHAKSSIEAIDPFQRGRVATACLVRVTGLLADERVQSEYSEVADLVVRIKDLAVVRSGGTQTAATPELEHGLREFLGPRDEPYEELPGVGAWVMDIASMADCVLDVWSDPSVSSEKCFEAMAGGYSITGYLEDDSDATDVPDLADGEFRKQMGDVEAVRDGAAWDNVMRESLELAQAYVQWFRHVPV
ncbi:hypothetical protein ACWGCK_35260 [Streptomyces virginiae]|uniref:hypothetical protein n=1 Tax=Streptomyces virginiae TaxID=1961 RepID=UPI0036B9F4EB